MSEKRFIVFSANLEDVSEITDHFLCAESLEAAQKRFDAVFDPELHSSEFYELDAYVRHLQAKLAEDPATFESGFAAAEEAENA
jgi:hypothetical protein